MMASKIHFTFLRLATDIKPCLRPFVSTRNRHETVGKPGFALWLWGNEARRIFCLASFLVVFLENPVFGLLKMAIFGDKDNMVERLVEIDARGFLDGTLTSRRVFQLTGPGTRVSPRYSWRFRVLTKGLNDHREDRENMY